MFNANSFVGTVIGVINPSRPCTIQVSDGYTTNADGSRTPSYLPAFIAKAQIQELTTKDLRHLDGLNLQGSTHAIYLNGWQSGAVRLNLKGGDLISLPNGNTYLTTSVVHQWPKWCKVTATLQNQTLYSPPSP